MRKIQQHKRIRIRREQIIETVYPVLLEYRSPLSGNRNEKVPFRCCVVLFAARKYSLDDTDRESSLALFLVIFETFFSVENGKNCTHISE